ncbi:hypothetical protein QUF95_06805 [Paenibacillus silvae]|uniref:hypothetical protein n=1 Tax=Paenibacillus silvae TaxID=1325358 RepID=UPI0025A06863|nr:hypothetical protein [Paenibacillus silvae]MDM5277084.1 hypothetical protein [Paenibacillus silvae]
MRINAKFILLFLSIVLLFCACSEKRSGSFHVELFVKEDFDKDNRLFFTGTTNLPNRMKLVLSITGEDGFSAQKEVEVNNGKLESKLISNNGAGLVPGKYILRITSQAGIRQPISVQNIIGKQGENLKGEFVLSQEILGKMIGYTYSFSKSDSQTSANEKVWEELNGYLSTGQYAVITKFIDKIQTPDQDIQMMYHFSKYHIYGQAGDDRKALESLYSIPRDYKGRNEDLINYYKYLNDFYKDESPFSFKDYVALYRKNRITPTSFAYYLTKSEQIGDTKNSDADTVYKYMMKEFDVLTDYGNNYVPEIHDPIILEKASRHFGMTVSQADEIFMNRAMQLR